MKVQLTESESINIGIGELAEDIYQHAKYLRATFSEEECRANEDSSCWDCRLRVFKGYWWLLTGDSSYDTDHRGNPTQARTKAVYGCPEWQWDDRREC